MLLIKIENPLYYEKLYIRDSFKIYEKQHNLITQKHLLSKIIIKQNLNFIYIFQTRCFACTYGHNRFINIYQFLFY